MFIRYLFFISFFTLVTHCFAQESITLAAENSWPPFSDKYGEGKSKEIIKAAYDAVNVKVEFVVVPYVRAVKMAENGEVDGAFNVTKQKSTTDILNFGQIPILKAKASFYYHKDSTSNFTSVSQIPKGATMGVIIGYEYGDSYQKEKHRFNNVQVANQEQLIKLLMSKRIDVAIMFDDVATAKLNSMGLKVSALKKGYVNHTSDIYVAFSRIKDTKSAMSLLEQGLTKVKSSPP